MSPAKTAEPIEMPFGLRTWVGPGNHVTDDLPMGRGNFEGEWHPIVKYRDTLQSSVQKQLNQFRCVWVVGLWALMSPRNHVLDGGPAVLRNVARATNFGMQFAITGFVGYNFGCVIASDTMFDSRGRFLGSKIAINWLCVNDSD